GKRTDSRIRNSHDGGNPRLLAKCGSAVEVLDKQQIQDPCAHPCQAPRTAGRTDSLPAVARPHFACADSACVGKIRIFMQVDLPITDRYSRYQHRTASEPARLTAH